MPNNFLAYTTQGMTKKPFVHPLRDSFSPPAYLRLRPLLGAFCNSGAVPPGLFIRPPLCVVDDYISQNCVGSALPVQQVRVFQDLK